MFEAACGLSVFGFDGRGCLQLRLRDSGSLDSLLILCGSDLVCGIVEQMLTDLPDPTLDRSMLYIQAWNVWGRIRISALGRCILESLDSDRRASSRLTRRAHFGGEHRDLGGAYRIPHSLGRSASAAVSHTLWA